MLVIIKHHREQYTPVWFSEQALGFDKKIFTDNCSDMWDIHEIIVEPSQVGSYIYTFLHVHIYLYINMCVKFFV